MEVHECQQRMSEEVKKLQDEIKKLHDENMQREFDAKMIPTTPTGNFGKPNSRQSISTRGSMIPKPRESIGVFAMGGSQDMAQLQLENKNLVSQRQKQTLEIANLKGRMFQLENEIST